MQIEVINRQRAYPITNTDCASFAQSVLAKLKLLRAQASIVFVSDRQMRRLNREFRAIDKATDVLSFSYKTCRLYGNEGLTHHDEWVGNNSNVLEDMVATDPDYLGDVVISTQTAARYAVELGLTFEQEVKTLILHGLLHLCGYDHETDNGEMERLEKNLRKRLLNKQSDRLKAASHNHS